MLNDLVFLITILIALTFLWYFAKLYKRRVILWTIFGTLACSAAYFLAIIVSVTLTVVEQNTSQTPIDFARFDLLLFVLIPWTLCSGTLLLLILFVKRKRQKVELPNKTHLVFRSALFALSIALFVLVISKVSPSLNDTVNPQKIVGKWSGTIKLPGRYEVPRFITMNFTEGGLMFYGFDENTDDFISESELRQNSWSINSKGKLVIGGNIRDIDFALDGTMKLMYVDPQGNVHEEQLRHL